MDSSPIPTAVSRWWTNLERDWRAVLLGFLALAVVSLGVPIPW